MATDLADCPSVIFYQASSRLRSHRKQFVALRQGDINGAADYIVIRKRDAYRKVFGALTIPLSEIDKVLTNINFIELLGANAEYEMLYPENGQVMSGMVQFRLDEDGIWRIFFF